jgi:ABC-2 type transport system ATP-binding protein
MYVIETRGLGKRYGSTWALRECTVTIPAGHVAALVGPNGAGKTTLLNLAAGQSGQSAQARRPGNPGQGQVGAGAPLAPLRRSQALHNRTSECTLRDKGD